MKAYIVLGTTGHWDDCREWTVCVFIDESKAKQWVTNLNQWCIQNEVHCNSENIKNKYEYINGWDIDFDNLDNDQINSILKSRELICPFDPKFDLDYTGTDYFYIETEIKDFEV